MKKSLLAVLFAMVLALAACGGGDDEGASEEPADTGDTATEEPADEGTDDAAEGGTVDTAAGEEVYANSCAMCHGADLSGGAGPNLTKAGSKYSAEDIADIVTNGKGTMQPQPVEGEDLDNLSAWLAEQK
ncbi:cytochrome c551 [Oceanobacillus bengalensis]|uniref:Cytochrome c n=1 Tax=Oceanobacillus bengalensis TaxID=1435466 RepID=A0A494Z875_9BACI|nr:cytochrome c [Oceanobacillus bengalensis]RKQ18227.1 cytochrome c [Oceanobacillus bengalensis]